MSTDSISAASTNRIASAPGSTRVPIQTLGQNDFLKLLVTQMTTQDPTNPQKDTEFIAQMAQFSSLEQSKTMQNSIAQLQANSLLGKTVSLRSGSAPVVNGTVSAVQTVAGAPQLMVNGIAYEMSQVSNVASESPPILTKTTKP